MKSRLLQDETSTRQASSLCPRLTVCLSLTLFVLSVGVTTACDMGAVQDSADAWDSLEAVYMVAADQGSLPMRIVAMVPLPTW